MYKKIPKLYKRFKNKLRETFITQKIREQQNKLFTSFHGTWKFYAVISCRKTNIFFTFYGKSSKFPERHFLFKQFSSGVEDRYAMKKGLITKILQRGRRKNQIYYLRKRLNTFRYFIQEFMQFHPITLKYRYYLIWNLYKIDYSVIGLLNSSFEIKSKFGFAFFFIYIINLKLNHNGCRGKKVRRIKKKAQKRAQRFFSGVHSNDFMFSETDTDIDETPPTIITSSENAKNLTKQELIRKKLYGENGIFRKSKWLTKLKNIKNKLS